MQAAENRTISLRAIDGRLARLSIAARFRRGSDAEPVVTAITGLLDAAGAGITTRAVAVDSGDASAHAGIVFEAPIAGNAPQGDVTITRLRSFYPVVRSRLPGLDLALVVPGETGIDDASIRLACEYARRFGRRRIHVVLPTHGVAEAPDRTEDRFDTWRSRFPEIEFAATPVAKMIGDFAAGKSNVDVVIAPPMLAEIINEVASVQSGAAGLVTVSEFRDNTVTIRAADAAAATCPAAALILAVADVLVWLSRADASGRIVNGWARTLEHGCHTGEFSVMSPYSRKLDASDFIVIVASRLGEVPRTLDPSQPGRRLVDTRAPAGRHLRLVRAPGD